MTSAEYPRCKTCRHWKQKVIERHPPLPPLEGDHLCSHPKLGDSGEIDNSAGDALWYEYTEGGVIHTGPEFGCIHHEDQD